LTRIPELVAGLAKPGDLVMTVGAGSVYRLGPQILETVGKLQSTARPRGSVVS
jgi:UDP-N-acetylmuramate--alanine ligase